ncbi:hypothetical protein TIFTF001_021748 [Ficus carica]|uniref:Uncharacterized protein n=1 Tax=Ficus carica TaxID=3494 RepID=A0AA88AIL0_FICCA|nr:hypothetical protein TIFTF001_021748 [Ficus carica]
MVKKDACDHALKFALLDALCVLLGMCVRVLKFSLACHELWLPPLSFELDLVQLVRLVSKPFLQCFPRRSVIKSQNLENSFAEALDIGAERLVRSLDYTPQILRGFSRLNAPFRLCAKSLHIMSLSMPVGMFVDCTTWVIVFVIRFVRGVSRTPRARSSNPGVEVVALCSCEEKRCSICTSNVLISSDIMLCIISSMFIVPGDKGPFGGSGKLGVKRRVEAWTGAALEPLGRASYFTLPEDSRA